MIGIQLEGDSEFLELPPDVSISLKLENPILSEDDRISPGSYSLDFNIPGGKKSPGNASKLKNPDVIENTESYVIQKAKLFATGDASSNPIPFKRGNLRTQSSNKDDINSYFTFGLNSISEEFKTAKLRDVLNEQFIISSSGITKKIYVKRTVEGDYDLTINGKQYTSSSINNLVILINADSEAALDSGKYMPYATEVVSGSTPLGLMTANYIMLKLSVYYTFHDPILDIDFWLRQDSSDPLAELTVQSEKIGEYVIEADLGDYYSEFDTFLSGYLTGSYPNNKLRFPLCFNANPYGEALKDGEMVNARNTVGFIKNDPNWGSKRRLVDAWTSALTFQKDGSDDGKYCSHNDDDGFPRYFQTKIDNNINHAPPTNPDSKANAYWSLIEFAPDIKNYNSLQPFILRKWILDKIAETFGFAWDGDFYQHADVETMIEWNTNALDYPLPFIGAKKFVFWKRSFNLSDCVPDITVVEYLRRLKSRYNLSTYYNELTQRVRLCFRENIAKNILYDDVTRISSPLTNTEDLRVTGYNLVCKKDTTDILSIEESVIIGTPEEVINIECGRIFQTGGAVIDGKYVSGPRVSQKFGENGQLRTIYYKGLIDVTTFAYSGADINGATIQEMLADFVLAPGLYSSNWKYWLQYKKNRLIGKLVIDFPLRKLVAFDWELKRRFDRSNYIIKTIDLKISNKRTEVTGVEIYTMR